MATMASLISTRLRLPGAFRRATASYDKLNVNSTICRATYSSLTQNHYAAASENIVNHRADIILLPQNTYKQQFAWFSDASSSSGIPPIDVTVTKSSSLDSEIPAHFKQQQYPTDVEIENTTSDDENGDSSPSSTPKLSKSQDQITEEEILELQSELRTHHRHAAYSAALETATELLERCTSHFGRMHPATASAYNNVGLMNKLLGNYVEAKSAFHESLQVYEEIVGKDHSSYAAPLSNLGMLERSRVLESEAEEGEDDNDASGQNEDDNDVELETLRDSNNPEQKTKLSALERMQLNESAIEYFDEAYRIRLSELGTNHPHTIQSRTQLGSAIAAAVIAERKGRMGGLIEGELRKLKQSKEMKDPKEMEAYIPEAVARAAAKSKSSSKLTQRRWDAAEEHLRGALHTAVENPRGESVAALVYVPLGNNNKADIAEQGSGRTGLTLPPKKDRSLSKKDRKMAEKERKREKRRANATAMQQNTLGGGSGDSGNTSDGQFVAIQGSASKVTTLSAATAAQNLAVFLKHYSDWMRLSLMDANIKDPSENVKLNRIIQEARHLYEAALHVRSQILDSHHPEVVASKFSLAELLDSPDATSIGLEKEDAIDSDRANVLREEILTAYNVEEREADKVDTI